MAQGDVTVFSKAKERIGDAEFGALSTAIVHIALVDATLAPTENDSDPRWAVGGAQDFSANDCAAGGNYAAGGAAVDGADTWTLTGNVAKFDLNDKTWAQNASNPTDATYCIGYVNDANDYCLFFLDIGGAFNMTTGDLVVTWAAGGVFTLT